MAKYLALFFIFTALLTSNFVQQAKAKEGETIALSATTLSAGVVQQEGIYLPRGFLIPAALRTPIDSRVAQLGDLVTMQVTEDVMMGEMVVIPANSFVHGFISEFKGPGRIYKSPKIEITFTGLSLPADASGKARKQVAINGKITPKQVKKASANVNDSMPFKKKFMYAGGTAGGLTALGVGYSWSSFTPLPNLAITAVAAVGAATAVGSLVKKDDLRINPGTKMDIRLQAPSMQSFHHDIVAEKEGMENVHLSPEEQFDRVYGFESQSL